MKILGNINMVHNTDCTMALLLWYALFRVVNCMVHCKIAVCQNKEEENKMKFETPSLMAET